jgi:PAS domain S-box-containing protein
VEFSGRKHPEQTLQESESLYKSILQTSVDGFWLVDMQGRILEANDSYCQMSGYSQEELKNMSISDLEAMEKPSETAAHI